MLPRRGGGGPHATLVRAAGPVKAQLSAGLKVVGQEPPSKKALDKVAFLQSKGVVGYNKKKN